MGAKITSIEKRRFEQFEDAMANIRPMQTVGKGRRMKVVTGSVVVSLSCCFVDERYQGMREHKKLNNLRNKFDVRKLTPITVVPHPEEGRFAIVDGQGRSIVCPEKGMDRVYATVLLDAPEDPTERLKFEAEYFIGQDSEVENVKPLEKHLARVIIGDEAALTLDKLFEKYDIEFTSKRGQRGCSILGSYTDTYAIAKVHGEKCLDFIFSVIENAGWNKEKNGYATFVMRALKEAWVMHPNDRVGIHTFLSKELRQIDPHLFAANAKAKYPMRDTRACCILYIEDMICCGLGIKRAYIDEGGKIKVLR